MRVSILVFSGKWKISRIWSPRRDSTCVLDASFKLRAHVPYSMELFAELFTSGLAIVCVF